MCQTGSRKIAADSIDIDQLHYFNAECHFWVLIYTSMLYVIRLKWLFYAGDRLWSAGCLRRGLQRRLWIRFLQFLITTTSTLSRVTSGWPVSVTSLLYYRRCTLSYLFIFFHLKSTFTALGVWIPMQCDHLFLGNSRASCYVKSAA